MSKALSRKKRVQKVSQKRRWTRQIKFYHNKGTKHFLLAIAKKGFYVAGHDMTTHPSLNKYKKPKKKYLALSSNPNPKDQRISYIDKKLRVNIRVYFEDTQKERLTVKKKWKLSKRDKKKIAKLDRRKLK